MSQRAINTGEEITADYTGSTGDPLWLHCQYPVHKDENYTSTHLLGIKREARDRGEEAKRRRVKSRHDIVNVPLQPIEKSRLGLKENTTITPKIKSWRKNSRP